MPGPRQPRLHFLVLAARYPIPAAFLYQREIRGRWRLSPIPTRHSQCVPRPPLKNRQRRRIERHPARHAWEADKWPGGRPASFPSCRFASRELAFSVWRSPGCGSDGRGRADSRLCRGRHRIGIHVLCLSIVLLCHNRPGGSLFPDGSAELEACGKAVSLLSCVLLFLASGRTVHRDRSWQTRTPDRKIHSLKKYRCGPHYCAAECDTRTNPEEGNAQWTRIRSKATSRNASMHARGRNAEPAIYGDCGSLRTR